MLEREGRERRQSSQATLHDSMAEIKVKSQNVLVSLSDSFTNMKGGLQDSFRNTVAQTGSATDLSRILNRPSRYNFRKMLVYDTMTDNCISELEQKNFFLGYSGIPEPEKFLVEKKMLYKPRLNVEEYGTSWERDLFLLGHNAMKSELRDLYKVVASLEKRGLMLSEKKLNQFFNWWSSFVDNVSTLLDCEEYIIFHWVEERVDLSGTGVEKNERMTFRSRVVESVEEVWAQQGKIGYLPSGEIVQKIVGGLSQLCMLVLHMMRLTITNVADLVEVSFNESDYLEQLRPAVVQFLRASPAWKNIATLIIEAVPQKERPELKKWLLRKREKIRYASWIPGMGHSKHGILLT